MNCSTDSSLSSSSSVPVINLSNFASSASLSTDSASSSDSSEASFSSDPPFACGAFCKKDDGKEGLSLDGLSLNEDIDLDDFSDLSVGSVGTY